GIRDFHVTGVQTCALPICGWLGFRGSAGGSAGVGRAALPGPARSPVRRRGGGALVSRVPGWLLRHRITIEAYEGESSTGPLYGPPVEVRAFVDEQTRTVRTPGGEETTSSSTAYAAPGTTAPPLSRVTLPSGRTTTVIASLTRDGGGLPTPDHVEIQLT